MADDSTPRARLKPAADNGGAVACVTVDVMAGWQYLAVTVETHGVPVGGWTVVDPPGLKGEPWTVALDKLGADGWELTGDGVADLWRSLSRYAAWTVHYVFKRPA